LRRPDCQQVGWRLFDFSQQSHQRFRGPDDVGVGEDEPINSLSDSRVTLNRGKVKELTMAIKAIVIKARVTNSSPKIIAPASF
jgi:hypothetical protein